MKKQLHILALGISLTLFSGCAQGAPLESGPHAPVELSAWAAYWDKADGLKEYVQIQNRLSSLSCFQTYYDSKDKLIIPDETREIAACALKEGQEKRYLSFVNDWKDKKGNIVTKDKALLKRILKNDERREAVIKEMVDAVKELECTGIELDFEAFFKDKNLLADYLAFTQQLNAACLRENLDLRIVLEPGMPMDAGLCEGPEYVVMFYNLCGKHSGPGPKADGEFIEKTLKKMEAIPGTKAAAFATGGCLWEDYGLLGLKKGPIKFLNEDDAAAIAKKHDITPHRDKKSYALYFTYQDKGHDYELWYADSETLNAWIKAAADAGINKVSIWRLGGNTDIEGIRNE